MTIPAFFAPKDTATKSAEKAVSIGQMLVRLNHAPRRTFEMQPGKITRPPSHERLHEGEQHHQQPRIHRVEFWFDWRSHHVGKRDAQSTAKHQIWNNAQRRQKNSETKKKNRK